MAQDPVQQNEAVSLLSASWQVGLVTGIILAVLGLIVTLHPSTSLNVIAVLLGILLLVAGLFHLVRALSASEAHRVWSVVLGLVFVILGVVLIRHLDTSIKVIALLIGLVWIVQGVVDLMVGFSGGEREGRGWAIFIGLVSLVAGIVVVAWPVKSVTVLAVLLGIWFIVLGLLEVVGALVLRHALKQAASTT